MIATCTKTYTAVHLVRSGWCITHQKLKCVLFFGGFVVKIASPCRATIWVSGIHALNVSTWNILTQKKQKKQTKMKRLSYKRRASWLSETWSVICGGTDYSAIRKTVNFCSCYTGPEDVLDLCKKYFSLNLNIKGESNLKSTMVPVKYKTWARSWST